MPIIHKQHDGAFRETPTSTQIRQYHCQTAINCLPSAPHLRGKFPKSPFFPPKNLSSTAAVDNNRTLLRPVMQGCLLSPVLQAKFSPCLTLTYNPCDHYNSFSDLKLSACEKSPLLSLLTSTDERTTRSPARHNGLCGRAARLTVDFRGRKTNVRPILNG